MKSVDIQVKIIDSQIKKPEYATFGAAGLDLRASITAPMELLPGDCRLISTGLAIYIRDRSFAGLIIPRSGLGHNHGLILGNSVGLIDSDYQGPLMISCWNRSKIPYTIRPGDRIAQLVVIEVVNISFDAVDEFYPITDRGVGGFGSTN